MLEFIGLIIFLAVLVDITFRVKTYQKMRAVYKRVSKLKGFDEFIGFPLKDSAQPNAKSNDGCLPDVPVKSFDFAKPRKSITQTLNELYGETILSKTHTECSICKRNCENKFIVGGKCPTCQLLIRMIHEAK